MSFLSKKYNYIAKSIFEIKYIFRSSLYDQVL